MDVHEASRVARCFGNWTKRVGGGDITVVGKRCFGNASVLSASINIEQHGHVKVRSLRQWRPVLSRYGMRGVRVGEASNPGPVTTAVRVGFWPHKWTVLGLSRSVHDLWKDVM